MKTPKLALLAAAMAALPVYAQKGTLVFPPPPPQPKPPPPPPVYVVQPPPPRWPLPQTGEPAETYTYEQKPVAAPVLLTDEQAKTIIDRFRTAYPKLGRPRFLIYVNRNLVDERAGPEWTGREERLETTRTSGGSNATSTVTRTENGTYGAAPARPRPSLADKQTVRDVERLFGRPLREAGAKLADQQVAAELMADRPPDQFIGDADTPQARRDREAVEKVADAVIEILISSKTVTVPTISGSQEITIPDIEATAIRVKDSQILGQASSSDVTSRVPAASLGNFSVNQITEATALALMEDMTPED